MKKLMLSLLCMLFTLSAAVFFAGCDENTTTAHTHAFVEQKIEQDFLASPATCTERAMYYFSCSCGEKGIGSFFYGEALGHNYVYGVCTRCGVVDTFFKPTDGLRYTLNSDGSSYSCTGIGTATDADVVIAKVYSGLPVTSIGSSAFSGCSGLTSITIPNSVTSIGYAFYDCTGLENIYYTGDIAAWCKIDGLDGLMRYGSSNKKLYINNELITGDLIIPDSVTSIGDSAFRGCSGLTSIKIPDSVTSIDDSAFNGCSGLTDITIPDSVTSIGDGAFIGCSGVESIVVATGNTKYHSENNCLIETESKTLIAGCKNSIIPSNDSVTSIGHLAFSGCSGLTSVTIGNGVKSIGGLAFSGCSGLTSITIPDSVITIEEGAFSGCSGLTSVTIPDSVTCIWWDEVYGCPFSGCSGLESIVVENGNTKYHSKNNCLIETASKTLIGGCKNSVIPSDGSVTSICSQAFRGCSRLISITIPDSVTSIGFAAFSGCSGLTKIEFKGTMAQWNAISKNNNWDYNTGSYTVYCTDGNITK